MSIKKLDMAPLEQLIEKTVRLFKDEGLLLNEDIDSINNCRDSIISMRTAPHIGANKKRMLQFEVMVSKRIGGEPDPILEIKRYDYKMSKVGRVSMGCKSIECKSPDKAIDFLRNAVKEYRAL